MANICFSPDDESKLSSPARVTIRVLMPRMAWDVLCYHMLPSRMCHSKITTALLQDWQLGHRTTKPS